ncbi:hypothetical protein GF108_19805 [Phyllobacterium sp. SYP-B3895]|uniref:SAM domain-containing protein n=1 Tax=Phyllobacterium sp. SYP-B3895 TaxID=2663240 RepID=UPI001299A62C|nr:SAM domain-containing protein [Phyllobacterium sp. SYP-B3895]MRG57813.1 hypothetical protein [Phyllobacterium sp. SYP-B3895]
MDIAAWLASLGLAPICHSLARNEITPEVLPHLSDADLKALELPMGPRQLGLAAIPELGKSDMATAGSTPRPEAERRQLTVMFVDLVGSTRCQVSSTRKRWRGDPQVSKRRGHGHHACGWPCREIQGDGVLAYFGWPRRTRTRPSGRCGPDSP